MGYNVSYLTEPSTRLSPHVTVRLFASHDIDSAYGVGRQEVTTICPLVHSYPVVVVLPIPMANIRLLYGHSVPLSRQVGDFVY